MDRRINLTATVRPFCTRRVLRYLYAVAVLLALGGCGGSDNRLPALDVDATILAFGDSLTFGTGAARRLSYPQQLQELIGRRVINAGVPGETTAEGLQRLPGVVERESPDLVILCLGGNDFLRRLNGESARDNLSAMIEMIQRRGIALVLMAVPDLKLLGGNSPIYRDLAAQYNVVLEDEVLLSVLRDRSLKADPIHPNAEGYRRIAEALADLLQAQGALR